MVHNMISGSSTSVGKEIVACVTLDEGWDMW